MKKLKILHIGNGSAFKIRAIVTFFRDRGHNIHFIPTPAGKESWEGIDYHFLRPSGSFSKLNVLRNMMTVRKIVKEVSPDIVHAHNAGGPGWYGACGGRHPFVIHAYGSDIMPYYWKGKNPLARVLTKFAFRYADRVIVTGRHMIGNSTHLGIPKENIKVIPRGVNLSLFRPGLNTDVIRKELGINNEHPVIFSPRYQIDERLYNIDTIIQSIPLVVKDYPEAMFIQLYDPGKEEQSKFYLKMAEDLGVKKNYKMVKAVDNDKMPLFYNLADIVLSVPSTDGFPVTVLEASACETPIIVTRLDYTSEWFSDGNNGMLVPEQDHIAVAHAIDRLCKDDTMREKMKKANRKQVEEKADYAACMLQLEADYYDLMNESGAYK